MVRLIPIQQGGKTVWMEDAPTCPTGHEGPLIPGWGPCPTCGYAMRWWRCDVDDHGLYLWDDEHQHRR